jgi:hypothetical protein
MEVHRPSTDKELIDRRRFLKKLAFGAGAIGIAGVTGLNILKAEKLQQLAWKEEISKRERECITLGHISEETKISKKTQDWVPEEVEKYNKDKRNALIIGTSTEAGIAYLAFKDKVFNKDTTDNRTS